MAQAGEDRAGVVALGDGGDSVGRVIIGGIPQRDHVRGGFQHIVLPAVNSRVGDIPHDGVVPPDHGIRDQQFGAVGHIEGAGSFKGDGGVTGSDAGIGSIDHQQAIGSEVGGVSSISCHHPIVVHGAVDFQTVASSDFQRAVQTKRRADTIPAQAGTQLVLDNRRQPGCIGGTISHIIVTADKHIVVQYIVACSGFIIHFSCGICVGGNIPVRVKDKGAPTFSIQRVDGYRQVPLGIVRGTNSEIFVSRQVHRIDSYRGAIGDGDIVVGIDRIDSGLAVIDADLLFRGQIRGGKATAVGHVGRLGMDIFSRQVAAVGGHGCDSLPFFTDSVHLQVDAGGSIDRTGTILICRYVLNRIVARGGIEGGIPLQYHCGLQRTVVDLGRRIAQVEGLAIADSDGGEFGILIFHVDQGAAAIPRQGQVVLDSDGMVAISGIGDDDGISTVTARDGGLAGEVLAGVFHGRAVQQCTGTFSNGPLQVAGCSLVILRDFDGSTFVLDEAGAILGHQDAVVGLHIGSGNAAKTGHSERATVFQVELAQTVSEGDALVVLHQQIVGRTEHTVAADIDALCTVPILATLQRVGDGQGAAFNAETVVGHHVNGSGLHITRTGKRQSAIIEDARTPLDDSSCGQGSQLQGGAVGHVQLVEFCGNTLKGAVIIFEDQSGGGRGVTGAIGNGKRTIHSALEAIITIEDHSAGTMAGDRAVIEAQTTGVDVPVKRTVLDDQVGRPNSGRGVFSISHATGIDITIDGTAIDDDSIGGFHRGGSFRAILAVGQTAADDGHGRGRFLAIIGLVDDAVDRDVAADGQAGGGHIGSGRRRATQVFSQAAAHDARQAAAGEVDNGVRHLGRSGAAASLGTGKTAAHHGATRDVTTADVHRSVLQDLGFSLRSVAHGLAASHDVLRPALRFCGADGAAADVHRRIFDCRRGSGIAHIGTAVDFAGYRAALHVHRGAGNEAALFTVLFKEVAADEVARDITTGHGQQGAFSNRGGTAVDGQTTGNDLAVDRATGDAHIRIVHRGGCSSTIGHAAAHNGSGRCAGVGFNSAIGDAIDAAAIDGHEGGARHIEATHLR